MKFSFNNSLIVPNKFQCEIINLARSKQHTLSDIAKQKNTYKKHILRVVHKFIEKDELSSIITNSLRLRADKLTTVNTDKKLCLACLSILQRKNNKFCNKNCKSNYYDSKLYSDWLGGSASFSEGSRVLRKFVVRKNGYLCSKCKLSEWNNEPLTLQLDHIDGNYKNNQVPNLRFLCPNCHSQTSTYGAKNKGNGRSYRRKNLGS